MKNHYESLGLPPDADDAQIRQRYLELVREFPPDRAPERFAEIRGAFDALKDPLAQLERHLFSLTTQDSLKTLSQNLRARLSTAKLPIDVLLSLGEMP